MQDGIISGNGNSRYLKTVSAALGLYPTYEDFMTALIAGTFPIDLNGINAAGWTQQGTALNKANLLSDTTASALGLTTNKTPNDAFVKLKSLLDAYSSKMELVEYIGTGTSGVSNPCSVTSALPIKAALHLGALETRGKFSYTKAVMTTGKLTTSYVDENGFIKSGYNSGQNFGKKSSDSKTISWYTVDTYEDDEISQLNESGVRYYVLLFH